MTDAAGNETRSDPVTVTTLNGSQPNGRGASRFVQLNAWLRSRRDARRRSAVVPYGSVRFAEGRLTDAAGSPIAGAVLDIKSRVQRPGARYKATGTVTTGEDGRFAYRIAKGASRTHPLRVQGLLARPRAGLQRRRQPRRPRRDPPEAQAAQGSERRNASASSAASGAVPPARARA